eukprot:comp7186_c0_seq1/m.2903 comp7186_c0_seq1/g.2903  ORF comp7186_c0_seq1/g.2903 comp7186_c0_seq1/m.2903 type:complete len:149 (-) comp7186_c0_seq1:344-790(-)
MSRMSISSQSSALDRYSDMIPLWGDDTPRERLLNTVLAVVPSLASLVTLICGCIGRTHTGTNVYLSMCMLVFNLCHLCLLYWYRQGELDPKVRRVLWVQLVVFCMLCISASMLFFAPYCPELTWRNCSNEIDLHCLDQRTNVCVKCPT